jgi:magnesium and cobalt transporter
MKDDMPANHRSWLEKISQALLGEPKDREQLITVLRNAQLRGLLDAEALGMIEGVFHVAEMRVSDIMIPYTNMVMVQKDLELNAILPIIIQSTHSRFPVVGEGKDEVIGILLAKDLLAYHNAQDNAQKKFNLRDIVRPAVFVPESKRLNILLNEFRNRRNHLAIVVDEYGSVSGLVTIEDILEQIVGEIEDEFDIEQEFAIRQHTETKFSVQALIPIAEFNRHFSTHFSDEEFDTIGGLVMQGFGQLPKRGESIYLQNIQFTVQQANHRRILVLKVNLTPEPKPEPKPEP